MAGEYDAASTGAIEMSDLLRNWQIAIDIKDDAKNAKIKALENEVKTLGKTRLSKADKRHAELFLAWWDCQRLNYSYPIYVGKALNRLRFALEEGK